MRAEKGAHLEIVCGLIPHLGFKSLTLRQKNALEAENASGAFCFVFGQKAGPCLRIIHDLQ